MEIKAWIQMGCERREVTYDVSEAEIERVGEDGLEAYIEEAILDWISCRYGWGWSCDLMTNDFSFMEDDESVSLVVTNEVLNPGPSGCWYNLELAEGHRHGDAKEGNALSDGVLSPQQTQGGVAMNGKPYVVTIVGSVWVDTTVAVMAKSEEEAARMALDGVDCDTEAWLCDPNLCDDPVVTDISEETWDELQYADQKHLLGPQPGGSPHARANH